jgi:tetratricopeptide (TPR) repeat protein
MRFTRLASSSALAAVLFTAAHAQRAADGAATAAAVASSMTAEQIAGALIDRSNSFMPEDKAAAESALKAEIAQDSTNPTWPLALGILKMRENEAADAKPYLKTATELAPNDPDALTWYANSLFSTINEASLFAKGRMAGQAKDMLIKAVEIDPGFVDARISLIEFYRNAPGIAGGSMKKAKENAEALLAYESGRIHGHRLLATIAMQEEDWDTANEHIMLAAKETTTGEDRARLLMAHAYGLLTEKKDPAAALPIAFEAYEILGDDADFSTLYVYARALAETGDCATAIPLFEQVLVLNEGAKTTRLLLAECLANEGQNSQAIAMYEEFLERFPKDDGASKAKKAIKELQKRR